MTRALFVAVISVLLTHSAALAQPVPKQEYTSPGGSLALASTPANVACDAAVWSVAAPACAYFASRVAGYHQAALIVTFTRTDATDLYMSCDTSADGAVPWGAMTIDDTSLSTDIRTVAYVRRWAGLAASFSHTVPIRLAYAWYRCRFWTNSGAGAGNLVRVHQTLSSP
jgi:hypothetical protein